MNRLALVLAAAAAVVGGTGCGSTCTSGTTLVSWTGFDDASGNLNVPCGPSSGVASVDLWLDGTIYVGNWPCDAYSAAVPGVPVGGNILDVEGLAVDGTILYRDSLSYTQPGCDSVGLPAYPGQGTAILSYAFDSGSGGYCTNGSTYMWFTIYDDIAGAIDPTSIDGSNSPRQWPCGPTDPVVTLPNGQYSLGPMDAMSENPPGSGVFTAAAGACDASSANPMTFTVTSGQQTGLTPTLVDGACLN